MIARELIRSFVSGFEGLLSDHPADNGNWYDPARYLAGDPQRRGCGTLVGSMRGVTAYALVEYRRLHGVPLAQAVAVTRADMLGIDELRAVEIGLALYYDRSGIAWLDWGRVAASILDKAWGSGPKAVIRRLQQHLKVGDDGAIGRGGATARAFAAWIAKAGEEQAAREWAAIRDAWDREIATNQGPHDPDAVFLPGWMRRTASWLPGTPFWRNWK